MEHSVISNLQKKPRLLAFIIGIVTVIVLPLNSYGLNIGITTVLPHFLYIPIIFTAYFFPRRGVFFACIISAVYYGMACILTPASVQDPIAAIGRIVIFILIAAVVSFLTLRMQESEHRHAMLVDAIPDMMFVISREGIYRDFRASEKNALLIPADQIIGKSIQNTGFTHELAEEILQHVARAIDTNTLQKFEYELTIPQGIRQFEARIVALNKNEVLGIVRDISERKQMETALIATNKKLNLLSSITRHDINNQIFSLKAFLELSKDSLDNAAELSEFLLKAERAANAIENQIVFTKEYQSLGVNAPAWQKISDTLKNAANALPMRDIRVVDETNSLGRPAFSKSILQPH
jgi:PAS domain S-box-containing protein